MNENKIDLLIQEVKQINIRLDNLEKNLGDGHELLISSITKDIKGFEIRVKEFIDHRINNGIKQIESIIQVYQLLKNIKLLPSSRGWAASPDFLIKLIELILKRRPATVLELGSGVSTVVVGLTLKQNNYGELISIDHDQNYYEISRENILFNEIENYVRLYHCPIKHDVNGIKWYDLEKVSFGNKVDLLIVDGPPGKLQRNARMPALTNLFPHLADNAVILLDDANREDEKKIIREWSDFLDLRGVPYNLIIDPYFDKGVAFFSLC